MTIITGAGLSWDDPKATRIMTIPAPIKHSKKGRLRSTSQGAGLTPPASHHKGVLTTANAMHKPEQFSPIGDIGHAPVNLKFAQLCSQDKQKIGTLIRKLINLKAEQELEKKRSKEEQKRLDKKLKIMNSHNKKIVLKTKELTTQFSTSLSLLKMYKEKLRAEELEKSKRLENSKELEAQLESARKKILEAQTVHQKAPEERNEQQERDQKLEQHQHHGLPTGNINQNEGANDDISKQIARLQRLLDIQDGQTNTNVINNDLTHSPPAASIMPWQPSQCASGDDKSDMMQQQDERVAKHVYKRTTQSLPSYQREPKEALHPETLNCDIGFDDDEDKMLVTELNRHPGRLELIPQLTSDCDLLHALESLTSIDQEPDHKELYGENGDSDNDEFLYGIAQRLNTSQIS